MASDRSLNKLSENEDNKMETKEISTETCTLNDIVPVTLKWENICVQAKRENRELLTNVTGIAKPGELMALMGASGAGKTTLLNMLMARNLKGLRTEGSVTVNGEIMGKDISSISGFAQQEELFVGTLTVKEYLMVQSKLRIEGSREFRENRVKDVLIQLDLWKCRDSRIGVIGKKKGISGGEARRLTFACEMLSNPSLLFADEPTSGLDSFMAENVLRILRNLAKSGRTIICTIHQPSSELYQLFHKVMYLANGRTAFLGTPNESIEFFERCGHSVPEEFNPSEWIIYKLAIQPGEEIASAERVDVITRAYMDSPEAARVENDIKVAPMAAKPDPTMTANVFIQLQALFMRCGIDVWRAPQLTLAKIIQKVLLGLFVGFLYFRSDYDNKGIFNINGALFFLVGELIFSTTYAITYFLNEEFALIAREYHDGLYCLLSYYVARTLSLLPLFSTDGLIMVFFSYWLVGLNTSVSQVLYFIVLTLLTSQAASAFGIAMSCIFTSVQVTAVMLSPFLIVFRLFSGFYGSIDQFPKAVQFIQYISFFRYAFEGFVLNQWSYIDSFHSSANITEHKKEEIVEFFGFGDGKIWHDIVGLILISLFFYAIGFLALLIRMKRAR